MSEKTEITQYCPFDKDYCSREKCALFDAEKGYNCCAIVSLVIYLGKLVNRGE